MTIASGHVTLTNQLYRKNFFKEVLCKPEELSELSSTTILEPYKTQE